MKTFNTYINEKLSISKAKSTINDFGITPIKRPGDCSWKYLMLETSVATIERLFGKPAYDCTKDSHFNFGVDKTSIEYYLSVPCEVDNKTVNYGITIYDYDAHEYDDEYDLPIYNKNDVFKFHIGTPGNSNEIRDIILETLEIFVNENNLDKEIKIYKYKFPWQP